MDQRRKTIVYQTVHDAFFVTSHLDNKWILQKQVEMVWTELMWHRTGTSIGLS